MTGKRKTITTTTTTIKDENGNEITINSTLPDDAYNSPNKKVKTTFTAIKYGTGEDVTTIGNVTFGDSDPDNSSSDSSSYEYMD